MLLEFNHNQYRLDYNMYNITICILYIYIFSKVIVIIWIVFLIRTITLIVFYILDILQFYNSTNGF